MKMLVSLVIRYENTLTVAVASGIKAASVYILTNTPTNGTS